MILGNFLILAFHDVSDCICCFIWALWPVWSELLQLIWLSQYLPQLRVGLHPLQQGGKMECLFEKSATDAQKPNVWVSITQSSAVLGQVQMAELTELTGSFTQGSPPPSWMGANVPSCRVPLQLVWHSTDTILLSGKPTEVETCLRGSQLTSHALPGGYNKVGTAGVYPWACAAWHHHEWPEGVRKGILLSLQMTWNWGDQW